MSTQEPLSSIYIHTKSVLIANTQAGMALTTATIPMQNEQVRELSPNQWNPLYLYYAESPLNSSYDPPP